MHPLFLARSRAYLIDCLCYLAVPAALVPVGLVVHRRYRRLNRRVLLALSAIPPATATLLAAAQESGGGTRGHRSAGLTVLTRDGRAPSFGRALLRNAVKIGAPWQLGHIVAIGAADGGFDRHDPWTIAPTAALYPWVAAELTTMAMRSGRGIHDYAASTHVRSRTPPGQSGEEPAPAPNR